MFDDDSPKMLPNESVLAYQDRLESYYKRKRLMEEAEETQRKQSNMEKFDVDTANFLLAKQHMDWLKKQNEGK